MTRTTQLSAPSSPAPNDDAFRTPPHNLEAEQALLGAILVNNEACDKVSAFLTPEHFFEPLHARIYEAASTLIRIGKLAEPGDAQDLFRE